MTWQVIPDGQAAVAIYNFDACKVEQLSLQVGDNLVLLEECVDHGWYRGFIKGRKTSRRGIFPKSYVHLKNQEELFSREVANVLREWGEMVKTLYLQGDESKTHLIRAKMYELILWRRDIVMSQLPEEQLVPLKQKIAGKIDWGNEQLHLDYVPRELSGDPVDSDSCSIRELYEIHQRGTNFGSKIGRARTISHSGPNAAFEGGELLHHVYVHYTGLVCSLLQGEEKIEVLLRIYDLARERFVSESFGVRSQFGSSRPGMSLSCLFTDLDTNDIAAMNDYYIVCHLVRNGKMDANSKKGGVFRRPLACAVVPMHSLVTVCQDDEPLRQLAGQLYTCDEKDFSQLHYSIIRKPVKSNERYGSVSLAMQLFHGDLPTVLSRYANDLGKDIPLVRKLGFPEVIRPDEMRNDIFVTIDRGEFEKGGKSTPKNLEVTMQVLNSDGSPLKVIHPAAGFEMATEYHTTVLYHNNAPRWAETMRLDIPFESVNEAHLLFTVKHCSKSDESRYTTYASMKIINTDGTTVSDAEHELCLFRGTATFSPKALFAHLPSTVQDVAQSPVQAIRDHVSQRESLYVGTRVCSTRLTRDVNLLGLLRWRSQPIDMLITILENIVLVDGNDICIFLQDTFDALFGILDTDNEICEQLVFANIVHLINLLSKRKYEHFQSILGTYIAKHFCSAMVYKKLVTSVRGYLDNAHRADLQVRVREVVESLTFLLKFIIQSRTLFARARRNMGLQSLKDSLLKVMLSLTSMLTMGEVSSGTKEAILKYFCQWLTELLAVFPAEELVELVCLMMTSAIPADIPKHPLVVAKLRLMGKIVNSSLFEDSLARCLLLPSFFVNNLTTYLQRNEELTLVWDIIGVIVSRLELIGMEQDFLLLQQVLVPPLVSTLSNLDCRQDPPLPFAHKAVCSFLGLFRVMTRESFIELHTTLRTPAYSRRFLKELFTIFRRLIETSFFEESWNELRLLQAKTILSSTTHVMQAFVQSFTGLQFDKELLMAFFEVSSLYVTQSMLQLETFTWVKRGKIEQRFGDMRAGMAFEISSMWAGLGEHKGVFIPKLIGPLVKASLVCNDDVRQAILPIFAEVLEMEFVRNQNFTRVDMELCEHLDSMITAGMGDDRYLNSLESIWQGRLQSSELISDKGKAESTLLIKRLVTLSVLLVDYRLLGKEDFTGSDRNQRMAVTNNLIAFYKENDQPEMYKRSIYKLAKLHIRAANWSEAAFSLLVNASSMSFSSKEVEPSILTYPTQTQSKRKESLYWDIIGYFDKCRMWEYGIDLCDELAVWYRYQSVDFKQLSGVLRMSAQFFQNIVLEIRPSREYFRVGYYGKGFRPFLRNRVFVYRGEEYEKLGVFSERIQAEHPGATLMTTNTPPGEDMRLSDSRYLQICTVKPIPDKLDILERLDVHEHIREFRQTNSICCFGYSRPFHKGPKDKENEFKSLWLERTTLTTVNELPSILPWVEVKSSEVSLCIVLIFFFLGGGEGREGGEGIGSRREGREIEHE